MLGCLTPICIDRWRRVMSHYQIFLLSHAHTDHTAGLDHMWSRPIYCSHFTANYINRTLRVPRQLLCPLDIDVPYVISLDGRRGTETMTLTLLDANHCPGSVMFLMEGYFGVILYTGDMRFHGDMENNETLQRVKGRVDILHLDNTYNSPSCDFPSREICIRNIVDIIRRHPQHDVVLGIRKLGKEDMLSKVALATKEWISVLPGMYETLKSLELSDEFVVNDQIMCRIRTAFLNVVTNENIKRLNMNKPTVAIIPTAIFTGRHGNYGVHDGVHDGVHGGIHVVPYSDHSSFRELRQFVAFIRPKRILPIVAKDMRGSGDDRRDMTRFSDLLDDEERQEVVIPKSVKSYMSGGVSNRPFVRNIKRRRILGVVFDDD